MSRFVLDCSVAMAWCFADETDAVADSVLDRLSEDTALVPSVWPFEVANVLLVAEWRGRIKAADAARFLDLLSALPITIDETTRERAWGPIVSLGREHGLSSYDAAYLELAMREGVPLASRDATLRSAAEASGVPVMPGG